MDVDQDVDGKLAQQLGCLGTSDKEALIRQFQQILGPDHHVTPESCAFFLDMNNWNLQAALGSYYDYGSTQTSSMGEVGLPPEYTAGGMPLMEFVQDVTIGEGESVPPSTRFRKTWRVRNAGDRPWPDNCWLRHIEGTLLGCPSEILVHGPQPGQCGDISADMTSPAEQGIYQSRWQLSTPHGVPFGEPIWCIIIVDSGGLLGITQQMATAFGCTPQTSSGTNPFDIPVNHSSPNRRQHSSKSDPDFGRNNYDFESCSPAKSARSSIGLLDMSTMANQGSPSSISAIDQEFDAPASPNGSSALCQAVAASVMSWQGHSQATSSSNMTQQQPASRAVSQPMGIQSSSTSTTSTGLFNDPPMVPPGTPNTPPSFGVTHRLDDNVLPPHSNVIGCSQIKDDAMQS